MFFRPEEEHGLSSEYDILPPTPGRDGEMQQTGFPQDGILDDPDLESSPAVCTARLDTCILFHHGGYTQSIPDAIRKAIIGVQFDEERGRDCRERVRH